MRQQNIYGLSPEPWDFKAHPAADIVIINLGTNDNNTHNNVTSREYVAAYKQLITNVHNEWPQAEIVCMSLWNGFGQNAETFVQGPAFVDEIPLIVNSFKGRGSYGKDFVH